MSNPLFPYPFVGMACEAQGEILSRKLCHGVPPIAE